MNSIDVSGPVAAWFKSAEGKEVLKDVCEQTRVDGIDVNPTAGGCKLNIKGEDADLTSLANMLLNIHIENQEKLLKHMSPEEVEEIEGRRVTFTGRSNRFPSSPLPPKIYIDIYLYQIYMYVLT